MQALTRNPAKLRRHSQDDFGTRRQFRPAPRRQSTRAAQIRAALQEG